MPASSSRKFQKLRASTVRDLIRKMVGKVRWYWPRLWMRVSGAPHIGRFATRLALIGVKPLFEKCFLAEIVPTGFISPNAKFRCHDVTFGMNVFIDDQVLIYQERDSGAVGFGDGVKVFEGTHFLLGKGGSIHVGSGTSIHRECQIESYAEPIFIGNRVEIAARCDFQSFDHGIKAGQPLAKQPLTSKGPIIIEDEAWLGHGAIILSGVRIGKGAVIGAGAVVTKDVPPGGIAVGVPARVVRMRDEPRCGEVTDTASSSIERTTKFEPHMANVVPPDETPR